MLKIDQFTHIDNKINKQLLHYWLGLDHTGIVPPKNAIDPLSIRDTLPFIWLCKYEDSSNRFKYHLIGEQTRRAFSEPVAQHYLDEITDADSYDRVFDNYYKCITQPSIVHIRGILYAEREHPALGERIFLPLADHDGTINYILGATHSDFTKTLSQSDIKSIKQIKTFTPLDGSASYIEEFTFL